MNYDFVPLGVIRGMIAMHPQKTPSMILKGNEMIVLILLKNAWFSMYRYFTEHFFQILLTVSKKIHYHRIGAVERFIRFSILKCSGAASKLFCASKTKVEYFSCIKSVWKQICRTHIAFKSQMWLYVCMTK